MTCRRLELIEEKYSIYSISVLPSSPEVNLMACAMSNSGNFSIIYYRPSFDGLSIELLYLRILEDL